MLIVAIEARGARRRLSGWHLVLVLEVVLVVFSFVYYLIAGNNPEEFAGLVTRLDALYFATTTTATVGFGDVHATGQLARAWSPCTWSSTSCSSPPWSTWPRSR